jgi:hypothetical protein
LHGHLSTIIKLKQIISLIFSKQNYSYELILAAISLNH